MKRREFIKKTSTAAVLAPTVLNGINVSAFTAENPLIEYASSLQATFNDKILVVIQLAGGNDGLNTIIPLQYYAEYQSARSNIAIPQADVLPLNGVTQVGFHPVMTEMQAMYNNNELAIYHSVGYPNPNLSHFRSTDIWMSASDSAVVEGTGWLGRYLDVEYPNYPTGYPNTQSPDPPAIQIGSAAILEFQGPNVNMAYTMPDADSFYNVLSNSSGAVPANNYGKELAYLRIQSLQAQNYTLVLQTAYGFNIQTNAADETNFANNSLYQQLKIVAKLINGGLQSKVYLVSVGASFDTHSDQVETTDVKAGRHADLLKKLSDGIGGFNRLLQLNSLQDRVLGMTFSEFGRRVISNGSLGTDHGMAAPMFFFGSKVNHGIFGTTPTLPAVGTATVNDQIIYQYDFRQLYKSVLTKWFCVPNGTANTIMLASFPAVNLISGGVCTTDIEETVSKEAENALQVLPNPFVNSTIVHFLALGKTTSIEVMDVQGRVVYKTTLDTQLGVKYEHKISSDEWGTGSYFIRVDSADKVVTKTAMKVR